MLKVKNRKVVFLLSQKSLRANRIRNIVAVISIVLTTMLFTALCTSGSMVLKSGQQQMFRQVGGDFHGSFKRLSWEQVEELKKDSRIKKCGTRLLLAVPEAEPFDKVHVELSYMDEIESKGSFCEPKKGSMPKEGTKEFTCDSRILKLLKIKPQLGTKVEIPFRVGDREIRDTFVLAGWWDYDPVSTASFINLPLSYVKDTLSEAHGIKEDFIGSWSLDVYFKNSHGIAKNMKAALSDHGYQWQEKDKDNFMHIGINMAYFQEKWTQNIDVQTASAILLLVLVFFVTGYLIIHNIFRISVVSDIQFYGLLKTIGTTRKQIRRMIYEQALVLSVVGIPVGLLLGYVVGNILTPVIISTLTYKKVYLDTNPYIFLGGTTFSLVTVLVSCRKPGKIAGKVSPIEAIRYTDQEVHKKQGKERERNSLGRMALDNLGRNRKKTVSVILSMSLAIVIFQGVYTFTNGFNMEKFAMFAIPSDFMIGSTAYFQDRWDHEKKMSLTESSIQVVKKQKGIKQNGRVYGVKGVVTSYVADKWFQEYYGNFGGDIQSWYEGRERTNDGRIEDSIQLYGMEAFPMSLIHVVAGDLKELKNSRKSAIAAIYEEGEQGVEGDTSNWAKLGDTVTLQYEDGKNVTYEVTAIVTVPSKLGYRYYCGSQFLLGADVLKRDCSKAELLNYTWNMEQEEKENMEKFLAEYTESEDPMLNYETKYTALKEFEGYRNMFLMVGSVLSGVIALVGILNFFNTIFASIIARKHEFAIMRSIGMTVKQLRHMLVLEGLWYVLFSIGSALGICIFLEPLYRKALEKLFFFVNIKFSFVVFVCAIPIYLLLGVLVPYVVYHATAKKSIVEQLRTIE